MAAYDSGIVEKILASFESSYNNTGLPPAHERGHEKFITTNEPCITASAHISGFLCSFSTIQFAEACPMFHRLCSIEWAGQWGT